MMEVSKSRGESKYVILINYYYPLSLPYLNITTSFFKDFTNGASLIDGIPMIGASGANGISSSEGGSLTGNGANDVDVPPPDLPPLPMPRFAT